MSDVNETRLALIDQKLKEGATFRAVARLLVKKPTLLPLEVFVDDKPDLDRVQTFLVENDIAILQERYRKIAEDSTEDKALGEYLTRLDFLYSKCIQDHEYTDEVGDRSKVLKLAFDMVKAKAQVLGVDMKPSEQKNVSETIGNLAQLAELAKLSKQKQLDEPAVEGEFKVI